MMFQRRQSLRHLFGKGLRNRAVEPEIQPIKAPHRQNKKRSIPKRRNSVRRPTRKKKSSLQHCMETIEKDWNLPPSEYDLDGNCKISTPDGRFHLVVSGPSGKSSEPEASPSLCISTCIYTCTSDVQSMAVVGKAQDMNDFVEGSGNQNYALRIDPSPSSSSQHDKANPTKTPGPLEFPTLPTTIALCFSRSTVGLLNSSSNRKSGSESDKLFCIIKEFLKVALSVQTKLESVDEGRLGMTPRPPKDAALSNYRSHVEFLAKPPSMVAKFMTTAVFHSQINAVNPSSSLIIPSTVDSFTNQSSLLSVAMTTGSSCHIRPRLSSRGRSLTRVTATRSTRSLTDQRKARHSKSARNILSQFSTPEEARVFELYARKKSKRKVAKNRKRIQKDSTRAATAVATDCSASAGPPSVYTPSGHAPKRMASLPVGANIRNSSSGIASPPPGPPVLSDWNKTPLISNKGSTGIARESHVIDDLAVPKRVPSPTRTYLPKSMSSSAETEEAPTRTEAGKSNVDTIFRRLPRQIVSERDLLNGTNRKCGGSTRLLL